jgi:hypothetical protein
MNKFKSTRQAWLELGLKVVIVVLGYLAFMSIVLAVMQLLYTKAPIYMD